jgi:hypothetical protein
VIGAIVYTSLPEVFTPGNKGAVRAAMRAGGDAIRAGRADAVRRVRESRAIKAEAVRRAVTLDFPSGERDDAIVWAINASGAPMPVAAYPYRQVKQGVSAQIKAGGRSLIRHAFIAKMKSGHEGVFLREGKARLPIFEVFTTRVTDVFKDAGFIEGVQERTKAVFRSSYERNLAIVLGSKVERTITFGSVAR